MCSRAQHLVRLDNQAIFPTILCNLDDVVVSYCRLSRETGQINTRCGAPPKELMAGQDWGFLSISYKKPSISYILDSCPVVENRRGGACCSRQMSLDDILLDISVWKCSRVDISFIFCARCDWPRGALAGANHQMAKAGGDSLLNGCPPPLFEAANDGKSS